MTVEDINAIGQAVAVVATIASLVFVGLQVRQNTRALKATSHHAVTDSFNAVNALIISDQKVARLWRLGLADWETLDEDERMSVSYMFLAYMRIFETLHYQFSTGVLEPKLFEAELNTLKWSVANPGVRAWWIGNPISFSAEFRAFIDGLIRDAPAGSGASL